jgi:hypothetical protein
MGDAGNRLTGGNSGGLHASPIVSDFASSGVAAGSPGWLTLGACSASAGAILPRDEGVRAGTASGCMDDSVLTFEYGPRSGDAMIGGPIFVSSDSAETGSSPAGAGGCSPPGEARPRSAI